MKKYNKASGKSWSIKLVQDHNKDVSLVVANSMSGRTIGNMLYFHKDGTVENVAGLRGQLEHEGYDPYEHNNEYNKNGSIKID